jgi:hypothetical protein
MKLWTHTFQLNFYQHSRYDVLSKTFNRSTNDLAQDHPSARHEKTKLAWEFRNEQSLAKSAAHMNKGKDIAHGTTAQVPVSRRLGWIPSFEFAAETTVGLVQNPNWPSRRGDAQPPGAVVYCLHAVFLTWMDSWRETGDGGNRIWGPRASESAGRYRDVTVPSARRTYFPALRAGVYHHYHSINDWPAGHACYRTHLLRLWQYILCPVLSADRASVSAPLHIRELRASPRHRRFLLGSGTLQVPPKAPISPAMASSGGISDQLFVSVKLESPRLAELDLHPHLFGSHPVAGSWDPCKAVSSGSPLARESPDMCAERIFDAFRFFYFSCSCRWSGRPPPCGTSAASSLRSMVSWLIWSRGLIA